MAKVKSPEEMTYEQAFRELEAAIRQLESGDLSLEEGLTLFERSQALAARCSELLDQAELRLRQLVPEESGGYTKTDMALDDEKEE